MDSESGRTGTSSMSLASTALRASGPEVRRAVDEHHVVLAQLGLAQAVTQPGVGV